MAFVDGHSAENQPMMGGFSEIKDETLEEMLDLEPDSVLKLSPDKMSESLSPQDYAKLRDPMQNKTTIIIKQQEQQGERKPIPEPITLTSAPTVIIRKPQLPVTSSHLKRPAFSRIIDPEEQASRMASSLGSGTRAQLEHEDEAALVASSAFSNSNGPKSRVPAGESTEKGPENKAVQELPDTLEPSQVMPGVSNASLVPATVTRDYGTNSRTRITLGGGYVRNKLPPSVDPTSSEYSDQSYKPSKQAIDRPQPETTTEPEKTIHESSRLIEVPERIVLPTSVFSQDKNSPHQQQQTTIMGDKFLLINVTTTSVDKKPQKPLGKLDSRCPKTGTTTLEHETACDKYYFCEDGHITEYMCPNGLLYGQRNPVKDYCVHRWEAVCGEKTVPNPISSPGCRWQWGIFGVQGSPRCTPDFYECQEGRFEVRKCSIDGQVYDDRTKSCKFAEQVGCAEGSIVDFKCPPDDQGNTYWPFPRYFLNERALIHCVNDKPAIVRCRDNERVDPEHLHCVQVKS